MKKRISVILMTAMLTAALAACSSGTGSGTSQSDAAASQADTAASAAADTSAAAQTTAEAQASDTGEAEQPAGSELEGEITFWHCFTQGARMEAIDAAAAAFMEANPGVKINIETMAWGDFNTKWNAGLTTGDLPDMSVAQNTGEVAEMINAGVLADISGVVDDVGRSRFSENALADMTSGGITYGVPFYSHAQVMWYREDLLEAANLEVPTTWQEFYDAAVTLTDGEVYGAGVSCSPNDLLCTRYLNYYVRSAGGSLLNDDLTANLTSDIALEGIKFWTDVYKNCSPAETINYTVNDHATLYYQGVTAFDFNSGFMIGGVANNRPDLLEYVSCAPLPSYQAGDPYYSAEATHIPLVIWNQGAHQDICQAFIEYLYEDENYLFFLSAVPVGMLPSITGISDQEAYLSNETVQQFQEEAEVIEKAVAEGRAIGFEHGPSVQAGLLTSQGVIEEMFQDILTNGTDIETAAQAAEDRLNEIFETMID